MRALPASSGDLVADRRLAWAEALAADGDPAAAAALLAGALDLVPGWVAGWYRLGELHQSAGAPDAAAAAFAQALALDASDRLGAGLRLDLLRRVPLAEAMPAAFVETLFDAYAPGFDRALVGGLGYAGPGLIAAALGPGQFARALDLGCGTGLAGTALRDRVGWLEGIDLSAAMLRQAATKGVYDRLSKADIQRLPPAAERWDLIVAADVLIYIGALEALIGWVAGALATGGCFAFTVESLPGEGFALGPARRYAHSEAYLRQRLAEAGFAPPRIVPAVLRRDRGGPVAGLVVAAGLAGLQPLRHDAALALA